MCRCAHVCVCLGVRPGPLGPVVASVPGPHVCICHVSTWLSPSAPLPIPVVMCVCTHTCACGGMCRHAHNACPRESANGHAVLERVNLFKGVCTCVYVCMCLHMCVGVCARACALVCCSGSVLAHVCWCNLCSCLMHAHTSTHMCLHVHVPVCAHFVCAYVHEYACLCVHAALCVHMTICTCICMCMCG